jgi:hypothetical protein
VIKIQLQNKGDEDKAIKSFLKSFRRTGSFSFYLLGRHEKSPKRAQFTIIKQKKFRGIKELSSSILSNNHPHKPH